MKNNKDDFGDELAERFLNFAARIIKLSAALPKTPAGKHIANQLLRCGTSPGANYEEARGAESRKDFIHKLGVVLKETKESRYWLKLILVSKMLAHNKVCSLLTEAEELIAIIGKSIMTARSNKQLAINN